MKTLILFYSFTGKTKTHAMQLAKELGADVCEIKTAKTLGKFSAFTAGCFSAMKQKSPKIIPITKDFSLYDKIILMGPIWAGFPAAAVNSALLALPTGKAVEFRMLSSSGSSKGKDKAIALASAHGCVDIVYTDIKA